MREIVDEDCILKVYNEENFNKIRPFIKYTCATILTLQTLLAIGSIKWRRLTSSFIYLELAYQVMISMVPNVDYNY